MKNDKLTNFLTKFRNAIKTKKKCIKINSNELTINICEILKQENFIEDYIFLIEKDIESIFLYIKYTKISKESVITEIKRISKPSRRVYKKYNELPIVFNNLGIAIISTSKGLMTNKKARILKIGGEVLFTVW